MEDDFVKFFKSVIILIVIAIGLSYGIKNYYMDSRNNSIQTAKAENWEWYYEGQSVNADLFDLDMYSLKFDKENKRVLMSDIKSSQNRNISPVIVPIRS